MGYEDDDERITDFNKLLDYCNYHSYVNSGSCLFLVTISVVIIYGSDIDLENIYNIFILSSFISLLIIGLIFIIIDFLFRQFVIKSIKNLDSNNIIFIKVKQIYEDINKFFELYLFIYVIELSLHIAYYFIGDKLLPIINLYI